MKKRKLPKDPKTISKLQEWLSKHSTTELAAMLGYKSSSTISQWIIRVRVAEREKNRVLAIIERADNEK